MISKSEKQNKTKTNKKANKETTALYWDSLNFWTDCLCDLPYLVGLDLFVGPEKNIGDLSTAAETADS